MKKVAILGSTGSIGTQALELFDHYREYFEVTALSTNENIDLLEEQVRRFKPSKVAVVNFEKAEILKKRLSPRYDVLSGSESLIEIAAMDENDIVLVAVVGIAGLEATLAALEAGKDIALANKETLVAGGSLVIETANRNNCKIIPVDSEHSAIFQCLQGCSSKININKIYLTASGGPFRTYDRDSLKLVTVEDALKHPNWSMGEKVTIDSATLMNKGLEVIEAKWLFNLDIDQIEILIHPQSIIHSMVEYVDGSVLAQMSRPDMRIPILYAFTFPERLPSQVEPINFLECGQLTFAQPDTELFPCLSLAYKALKIGGTMPVVLNAANEVAVKYFLEGRISFVEIPVIVERAMRSHQVIQAPTLRDILRVDNEIRELLV
jgi:1-deoxy-D-xylulose-5-phosphate reductoisomerase